METRIPFVLTKVIFYLLFRLAKQGKAGEGNIFVYFISDLDILMHLTLFPEQSAPFVLMLIQR